MDMHSTLLSESIKNIFSQTGEDGIIDKIFSIVGSDGWCVEFGAWDGIHHSNTRNLICNKGYSAVLIEANAKKFKELIRNYAHNMKVVPINAFVGFNKDDGLDAILSNTNIPRNFDLLSIDIDGTDYHVWEAVQHYRPKVVVIEYNPTIANEVEFIQPRDARISQGSSILSIDKLARRKGYELVAATLLNAIFVDKEYYKLFNIKDNSVGLIRKDRSLEAYIFSGYDGTVFIKGYAKLLWHELPYSEFRLQQLPCFLRKFPGSYGIFRKSLFKIYKRLRFIRVV